MRWSVAIVSLGVVLGCAAGCKQSDGPLFPINPGGPNNPGGGDDGVDARAGSDASLDVMSGRVCLIVDARQPDTCATTGAGGLNVTLDGSTSTTQPDGTFEIDVPHSSNIAWEVNGTNIMTSVMSYSAVHQIPVIGQADYYDLANSNSVVATPGQGDVFVHVTHQGASVAMVTATAVPAAEFPPLYDGNAPTTWTQVSTAASGMVWIPGIAQGAASVTLTPPTGTPTVVSAIPIGDGTLTWVSAELP
ncbi:MAG: hypothetical protein ABI467_29690 [Kofleriaceae bacterium]